MVGGLYGANLGKCFFGESMFSKVSNASKIAMIMLAKNLAEHEYHLIDCQIHTDHLQSLGAEMIPRMPFLEKLATHAKGLDTRNWNEVFRTDFQF